MLKVDCIPTRPRIRKLHSHTHERLIDRAAALGYGALAITLHDCWLDLGGVRDYARGRGITLIAGVEKTVEGKHVLLINFDAESEGADSFEKLARLRRSQPAGLVVAPHPFYPARTCLGQLLETHAGLFEPSIHAFYTCRVTVQPMGELARRPQTRWPMRHPSAQQWKTFPLVTTPTRASVGIRSGRVEFQRASHLLRRQLRAD